METGTWSSRNRDGSWLAQTPRYVLGGFVSDIMLIIGLKTHNEVRSTDFQYLPSWFRKYFYTHTSLRRTRTLQRVQVKYLRRDWIY